MNYLKLNNHDDICYELLQIHRNYDSHTLNSVCDEIMQTPHHKLMFQQDSVEKDNLLFNQTFQEYASVYDPNFKEHVLGLM